jgi:hypothetical protein
MPNPSSANANNIRPSPAPPDACNVRIRRNLSRSTTESNHEGVDPTVPQPRNGETLSNKSSDRNCLTKQNVASIANVAA